MKRVNSFPGKDSCHVFLAPLPSEDDWGEDRELGDSRPVLGLGLPLGKDGPGTARVLAYVCKRISIQSGVSQTRGSPNRSVGSLLVPFPDSFVPELGAFKRTFYRLRYFEDVAG